MRDRMTKDPHEGPPSEPTYDKQKQQDTFSIVNLFSWVIVPGTLGMVAGFLLGKMLPFYMSGYHNNLTANSITNQFISQSSMEFNALMQGNFAYSNLWLMLMFGFIFGMFIKFAFSDD